MCDDFQTVSGRVARKHPALRGQYLKWQEWALPEYLEAGEIGPGVRFPSDEEVSSVECRVSSVQSPEPRHPSPVTRHGVGIAAIIAVPQTDGGSLDLDGAVVITPFSTAETQARLGDIGWRVFAFTAHPHDSIDVLNPAAVRKFIELTPARCAAEVSAHCGQMVPSLPPLALPWSPRLPHEFRRRRGTDLWLLLPALVADCGLRTAQVRQDFQETVVTLFLEGFYRPLAEWCEAHRLALTGPPSASLLWPGGETNTP